MEAVHHAGVFVVWHGLLFPFICFQPSYNQSVTGNHSCWERFGELFGATKLLIKLMVIQRPETPKLGVPRYLALLLSEKRPTRLIQHFAFLCNYLKT
jgi:hypothetical protein